MKRGIAALFFVLVCFNLVSAYVQLSPEHVGVTVDGDAPIIQILSPGEITYSEDDSILVNYTIIEQSLDSVWYSFDAGTQINILETFDFKGAFYLDLGEGNYSFRIYANDSFGRINFTEVNFRISDSIPNCGNNICDSNEDCNSCSHDCGGCPPVVSDSGGSGKGSFSRTSEDSNGTEEENAFKEDELEDKGQIQKITKIIIDYRKSFSKINPKILIFFIIAGLVLILIIIFMRIYK